LATCCFADWQSAGLLLVRWLLHFKKVQFQRELGINHLIPQKIQQSIIQQSINPAAWFD